MTEIYLKRQSGISIEMLRDSFERNKISHRPETTVGDDKYFRVSVVKIGVNLIELFNDYNIIPSIQQKTFNERENFIELYATYNLVVNNTDNQLPENDSNYIRLTDELVQRLQQQIQQRSQLIDRIRIISED